MPKIILLNEDTACRIAAGEVIERPVSIVKELVENSLDADADLVNIAITNGGIGAIEVVDNGCGISQEDTPLAFHRHATSKIISSADLENIRTLGFRGEALPSIASVAHLTIKTRVPTNHEGFQMVIQGGQVLHNGPVGCPVGTMISVKDIFFNTPARRKHLKSKTTEGGLIADFVYKMALIKPQTKFIFNHNGREVFRSPGSGKLHDVLASVYDVRAAKMMLPITGEEAGVKIDGYISKPELSRSTRQHMTVAVNGRLVHSSAVNTALEQAYRGKLTVGRYPVAVILIWLPFKQVDVNVHPAKMEIKMENEEQVMRLVISAASRALRETNLIPCQSKLPAASEPYKLQFPINTKQYPITPKSKINDMVAANWNGKQTSTMVDIPAAPVLPIGLEGELSKGPDPNTGCDITPTHITEVENAFSQLAEMANDYRNNCAFPDLHVIGQLMNTYILTQTGDGFFVVDQHAAHERILFEKFLYTLNRSTPEVQYLLTPVNISLRLHEKELLKEYAANLQAVGFVFEDFGRDSLLLRGIPVDCSPRESEQLIADLVETIIEQGKPGEAENKHAVAALLACKAAIKAGDRLSMEAMQMLIARLARADEPYTCPHGRPTTVSFTRREIDAMFKRT
ncbi:DNA mismatch repair protein MutL [Sporotomaculum syntrophicum]|uniref:DNA mismatch repair protein MutL n=1 Tax=Sporotomaculum syntrophicum TaxID=182264 RepID=A0A9D3AVV8_9FIRM|nr:DNA mismatch repair endonuclease MutL [Sporotomaculum syntrophicum]KAF1084640.1 DNA mismatch repair protein MutL [Sporotomaculum syntrophicum]